MTNTSQDSSTRSGLSAEKKLDLPPGAGTFGMVLFLASLTMLFAASLVGYGIIRSGTEGAEISLPLVLWFSTGVLLISSAFLHYASLSLRAGNFAGFRRGLLVTLLSGLAFCALQMPGLLSLIGEHHSAVEADFYLYAFVVFLVIVHALHVIGGLIPMAITLSKAMNDYYSASNSEPIRRLSMYWHFLDAVWIVMFSAFLVLG